MMPDKMLLSRRTLLKAGGALALAFNLFGPVGMAQASQARLPGSLNAHPMLNAWIRINADGTVTLLTGKVELGQGILTALSQVAADELDIDIERLNIISGDTAQTPDEGTTAGSLSMPNGATAVRYAAAEVRHILLDLAAQKLDAPIESLSVEDGTIKAADGRSLTYWDLVQGLSIEREATGTVQPKDPAAYRYIGQPVPRRDFPAKVLGEPAFVQDYRPQGMVHGRVLHPPSYGAKLVSVETAQVEAMPGVLKVVRDGSFLGVIAEREDQAMAAVEALESAATWEEGTSPLTHDGIYDWMKAQDSQDIPIKDESRSTARPVKQVAAVYRRPYHMHGSIGSSAAVALFDGDQFVVQTHSQSVYPTAAAIAEMLGLPREKVRLQHLEGSGCYGHNGADDVAADAALLARALPGRPVRVQWRRADEHAWEPYGSAMHMELKAGISESGEVIDWVYDLWSTPHGTRPGGRAGNLLAARSLATPFEQPVPRNGGAPNYAADRNAIVLYDFPNHKVTTHFITAMPVRVSSTRGLGAYGNVFATESFMDEVAHAAGADPVEYRLRQLKDARSRAVIEAAAEKFGWSTFEKKEGHGRGIAFAQYKNLATYCAVCLEVAVDPSSGVIRVLRAVAAADAGHIVNPDGVSNQIEGGIVQSLSWTLKEQVRFSGNRIESRDWFDYPILTFSEVPPIEVVLLDQPGTEYLGAGEASQGPTGAALANAVFDATGVRLRDLPFTPERVKEVLA
ncbi:molybdopterin cofactor-binding domain-containing protein [Telmatospirillum sp. J64-1]|uniref:xanthine dehydrogenase family protein molybdopterin-binding subunit n=1 Tax=Telmatospirillum sp. J64-1 TaxID=2502183 RepID=UPI001C8F38CA|nr:molybdopterin cofactor-binding domain-containing protein [Telmatospirillum sp. J64-1]